MGLKPVIFRAILLLGTALSVRLLLFPNLGLLPGWIAGTVAAGILLAVIVYHDDVLDWVHGDDDESAEVAADDPAPPDAP